MSPTETLTPETDLQAEAKTDESVQSEATVETKSNETKTKSKGASKPETKAETVTDEEVVAEPVAKAETKTKSKSSTKAETPSKTDSDTEKPAKAKTNCRVIVVTSGKGGVGKTTSTANIGAGLAKMGYRVAMIDTDIGLRNLDILMGLENRIVYNIVDVVEERCKLSQALVKDKRLPNLCLLPAAQTRDKSALDPEQVTFVVEQLEKEFDFVFIDSPAGIEQGFQNAVVAATEAIVVATPEMSSVRDADRIIGLLETKEQIKNYKLVLNRVRPDMMKTNDMMDVNDVLEILSIKLLGLIPEDKDIIVSTNRGEPIVLWDNHKGPKIPRATEAYQNIARRVAGEDVPFMSLEPPAGFMDKVKGLFKLGGQQ